jgi:hypothetical protein
MLFNSRQGSTIRAVSRAAQSQQVRGVPGLRAPLCDATYSPRRRRISPQRSTKRSVCRGLALAAGIRGERCRFRSACKLIAGHRLQEIWEAPPALTGG